MNEDLVSYFSALKLKKVGFNEPCDHYYEVTHWERTVCFPLKRKDPTRYNAYKELVKAPPEINLRKGNCINNSIFVSREDAINLTPNDGVIHRSVCTSAPSLYHAQKWLREKKGIEIVVEPRFCNYKHIGYDWKIFDDFSGDYSLRAPLPFVDTYEAALSIGISSAIDLLSGNDGDR